MRLDTPLEERHKPNVLPFFMACTYPMQWPDLNAKERLTADTGNGLHDQVL